MNSKSKLQVSCLAVSVTMAFAWAANAEITQGLIGHWTFDETAGTEARDSSGRNNHGQVSNQVGDNPQWGVGKIGGALSFRGPDGGGDAVIVPDLPVLTNAFSVSGWVWADARDGTWPESAIVKSSGITSGGPLGLVIRLKDRDQDFGPLGNTSIDAGGAVAVNEAVAFPVTNWQHVAVVGDGTRIHLYRNGVEVGSAYYLPPLAAAISPETGIGVSPDDGGAVGTSFWQGKIDDVGIWNVALSPAQVASIFNAGQDNKDLTQADAYENVAPTISTEPVGLTRFVGETATFTVMASGAGTLAYQWKFKGTAIPGATNSTFTISSVREGDAGQYMVVVSNANGSRDSQSVTLIVQPVSIATGLLGYWKFDENQGETAMDATTNQNNGTLGNFPGDNSQWTTGQVGGAVLLGGAESQQFISVADYPKPTSTLTVSCWVNAESVGAWTSFVKNWGDTDAGQFHFGISGDGQFENIYIKQADGKTPNCTDPAPFPTNQWQHCVFVCDGTMLRLYRNGVQVASASYDGTLVTPPMNCIGIGAKMANDCSAPDPGAAGWLDGRIDDVAIWNRGLNPNEVLAIYQAGVQGKGVLEADTTQNFPPELTSISTNLTLFEGKLLSLSAQATGTAPLNFQWYKDGQVILNGTNSALNLGPAEITMSGKYKLAVTNGTGGVESGDIMVSVLTRPAATLISEWKFEENLADTSGGGNDGAALGTVEYVPGMSGKAVRLAPGNPIVKEGALGIPMFATNSWSLNLWLRMTSPPRSLSYVAGFGPVQDAGGGTARALLAFSGPQANNLYVWGSNSDTPSTEPYPLNRWGMVTLTYDGADSTTSLYLDGQLVAQNVAPRADLPESEQRISLAPTSNWNADVGGDFDEFTLWNGVLAGNQLKQLATVGNVAISVSVTGTAITITWPSTITGFILETTEQLPGGTWTAVPDVTGNSATVNAGAAKAFFRLKK